MQKLVVVVGTTSALKVRAVAEALQTLGLWADIVPCEVESWVSIQPRGEHEIQSGAHTRVNNAVLLKPGADFYIGIESGLIEKNAWWFDIPCVYIRARTTGYELPVFGGPFPIPDWMVRRALERKTDLGEIIKELTGDNEKDAQSYLSNGVITREQGIIQTVCSAFAPLLNSTRYQES